MLCRVSDAGPFAIYQSALGPAFESLQGRNPRCTGGGGRLWGLYERGHCQAELMGRFYHASILLFDLKSPFFRSDPGVCGARRARSVKDGAIAPPSGLVLD